MFDDPNLKNRGQVPSNLPIGEPEDIFDAVEKRAPLAVQPSVAPKAENRQTPLVSSAVSAGKLQVKTSTPPLSPSAPRMQTAEANTKVMPEAMEHFNKIKGPIFARNLMIMVVILIVIGLLGGGSWLVYSLFMKPPVDVNNFAVPRNAEAIPSEEEKAETIFEATGQTAEQEFDAGSASADESVLFGEPVDSDADSLGDIVEGQLGTDPDFWDTDRDGLSDGDEVKNGYNPIGSGTIFEIPQE